MLGRTERVVLVAMLDVRDTFDPKEPRREPDALQKLRVIAVGSRVKQLQNSKRSYAMLEELNVRPRLQYLGRVKNPNPELA